MAGNPEASSAIVEPPVDANGRLFEEGENCWHIAPCGRLSFLIDAAEYFDTLADAMAQAQRSIFIVGWDIHSRLRLRPGDDDFPELGPFLDQLAARNDELDIYILVWDHALIYALERELLSAYNLGFKSNERVHFHRDDRHPVGGSHHQKMVVIDDAVAFCGGIDLTINRWDTPEHTGSNPRRTRPDGSHYGPFHDLQVACDGDAARRLGQLCRKRWERATGEDLPIPEPTGGAWPASLEPDLQDCEIALSRTDPCIGTTQEVREIERLHLDAIAAARQVLYIENQYLTAACIGDALARRLAEEDGPEIVLVLPRNESGWLEQNTMGVLRERILRQLRAADEHDRLRVLAPVVDDDVDVYVHGKALIADRRVAIIGSANLSNRSMGFDTECAVAIDAALTPEAEGGIGRLRARLLGEHVGCPPDVVDRRVEEEGTFIGAVDALSSGPRRLEPLVPLELSGAQEVFLESQSAVDPEEPWTVERQFDEVLDSAVEPKGLRRYGVIALLVAACLALAVLWRFTPAQQWVSLDKLMSVSELLSSNWWGPVASITAFVLGGVVFFPVTLLIIHTALTYGAWTGFATALAGVMGSALATYGIGALLGRKGLRHFAGKRVNTVSERLADHGTFAVATVRIVPVAPYTVINLVAGASHIGLGAYLLGTLLGMTPGLAALTVLGDRLGLAIRNPEPTTLITLGVTALLVVGALAGVGRWLKSRMATSS